MMVCYCKEVIAVASVHTADNLGDLDEIDPKALEMMEFIPCKTVDDVLKVALEAK